MSCGKDARGEADRSFVCATLGGAGAAVFAGGYRREIARILFAVLIYWKIRCGGDKWAECAGEVGLEKYRVVRINFYV